MTIDNKNLNLVETFLQKVSASPDFPFLNVYGEKGIEKQVTFAEMHLRVKTLANFYNKMKFGNPIAIFMRQEVDFLCSMLAAWATGRTCVIMNSLWNEDVVKTLSERLSFVDCVYNELQPTSAFANLKLHNLGEVDNDLSAPAITGSNPPAISLINHSSGSTGVPKSMPFRMERYCLGPDYGMGRETMNYVTALLLANSFALTTYAWVSSIYSECGKMLLPKKNLVQCDSEAELISWNTYYALKNGAERLVLTPNLLLLTLQRLPSDDITFPFCKYVVVGGEPTPRALFPLTKKHIPSARVYPQYGSTETGLISFSAADMNKEDDSAEIVYIPGANVKKLMLVDENNVPVEEKPGNEGFPCVYSDVLSEPYVGDDPLTIKARNEVFVTVNGIPAVLFSDLAVWTQVGDKMGIVIKGRVGRRVKINGVYYDLGYFDDLASGIDGVEKAMSFLRNGCLYLCFTSSENASESYVVQELNRRLGNIAFFSLALKLDKLPYNSNAKVDMKRLEAILNEHLLKEEEKLPTVPSSDIVASSLSKIVSKVLALPQLEGKDFGFRTYGLDSIRAVLVGKLLEKECGVNVPAPLLLDGKASPTQVSQSLSYQVPLSDFVDEQLKNRCLPKLLIPQKICLAENYTLVTGANGFFGRRLLEHLLEDKQNVVCVLRNSPNLASRIKEIEHMASDFKTSVIVWAGDVTQVRLGLTEKQYDWVSKNVRHVVHSAAGVHWTKGYEELYQSNVEATIHVLNLCSSGPKKLTFISGGGQEYLANVTTINPGTTSGYALSKHVAEECCRAASKAGIPVCVYRPGLIVDEGGLITDRDFFWRFLQSCINSKQWPIKDGHPLTFHIVTTKELSDDVMHKLPDTEFSLFNAYHSVNGDELRTICERVSQKKIINVPLEDWLHFVKASITKSGTIHPLFPLQDILESTLLYGEMVSAQPNSVKDSALPTTLISIQKTVEQLLSREDL
ncbi:hypothetical protein SJAG_02146 [Schizosaccharomyces japonicus yFS275]|uniref:Carrier domain-containing protein n=1 Tax=Schizosaccharomyces japonicus (strain yFS275 / FY16936) TaxID=402676 RepID=B6K1N5_SCHJY|nr:hypothetical protein SJAG_02146 [Schizosaccharomyces japonicus yFS275]EEB07066.1 hypothetical protein SJAG_02146 [Schizosaccharomyces japonicus yFS275]